MEEKKKEGKFLPHQLLLSTKEKKLRDWKFLL
jgi:hypothetical protein